MSFISEEQENTTKNEGNRRTKEISGILILGNKGKFKNISGEQWNRYPPTPLGGPP